MPKTLFNFEFGKTPKADFLKNEFRENPESQKIKSWALVKTPKADFLKNELRENPKANFLKSKVRENPEAKIAKNPPSEQIPKTLLL